LRLTGTASGYLFSLELKALGPTWIATHFPNTPVGTHRLSPKMTLEVRNVANVSLVVDDVFPTGTGPAEPVISNNTCRNVQLGPGATCTVDVQFYHADNGDASRSFIVRGRALRHPNSESASDSALVPDSGPVTLTSTASGFVPSQPPPSVPPGSPNP
jgi:hypothetical protein